MCQVNYVVYDSDWEAEFCRAAESNDRVKASLGAYGRRAFAEMTEMYAIESDLTEKARGAFDQMIDAFAGAGV